MFLIQRFQSQFREYFRVVLTYKSIMASINILDLKPEVIIKIFKTSAEKEAMDIFSKAKKGS